MASKRKLPAKPAWPSFGIAALFVVAIALGGGLVLFNSKRERKANPPVVNSSGRKVESDATVFAAYGKSASCKSCHEGEYKLWQNSHHGLAERQFDAAQDKYSFDPTRKIHHGTQDSEVRLSNGKPQLVTAGLNGERKEFSIDRVIGVDPLKQFLIAGEGGRWQSTELAFAPEKGEWFDVYGDEDRKPGEWGHWTGRGMTWNQMCAACHNTRVRKNYDARADSYNTTMSEMTVSCESCHGPMANHNAWQQKNPNAKG